MDARQHLIQIAIERNQHPAFLAATEYLFVATPPSA